MNGEVAVGAKRLLLPVLSDGLLVVLENLPFLETGGGEVGLKRPTDAFFSILWDGMVVVVSQTS